MTRRKLIIGPKPHTQIEVRSRPGAKPAWSRTLLMSDAEKNYPTMRAFVDSASGGVAGMDAFMDDLERARDAAASEAGLKPRVGVVR